MGIVFGHFIDEYKHLHMLCSKKQEGIGERDKRKRQGPRDWEKPKRGDLSRSVADIP